MTQIILTCGLCFGDEGKGTIVEALVARHNAHTVVRYSGGPQAAHTVVEDGRHHVFAQFGSGTLLGAKTHLSRFMLVDPLRMAQEAAVLNSIGVCRPLELMTIDEDCPMVTPLHRMAGQLRELARTEKHGSTGMGIWETTRLHRELGAGYVPMAADLQRPAKLAAKLNDLRNYLLGDLRELRHADALTRKIYLDLVDYDLRMLAGTYETIAKVVRVVSGEYLYTILKSGCTVFEGSQGVLLDENNGFFPHVTGTTTTLANAEQLLGEAGIYGPVRRIGILRSYMTRHGAGPLPTEMPEPPVMEAHNKTTEWAGVFRAGPLDMVALRYAMEVEPVDELAVTHLDQWKEFGAACIQYRPGEVGDMEALGQGHRIVGQPTPEQMESVTKALSRCVPCYERWTDPVSEIENRLGRLVTIQGWGPRRQNKIWR